MIVVVLPKEEFKKWMDGKKGSTFKDSFMPPVPLPDAVVEEVVVAA